MRLVRIMFITSSLAAAGLGAACGSSSTNPATTASPDAGGSGADAGGTGADAGGPSTTYPAFKPSDAPQVVTFGGPVLQGAKIYPVFFSNDDATAVQSLTDFTKKVGQTAYWTAAVTEYGAGAATMPSAINLTAVDDPAAMITDADIQAFLAGKLNANDPAFPAADANSLYALFYPSGTTINLGTSGPPPGDGGTDGGGADGGDAGGGGGRQQLSCQSFGGYHGSITLDAAHGNMNVAYAVVPRCASFPPLTGLDGTTAAASHEYIEAVTDPYVNSTSVNPAYSQVDDNHFYWETFLGGGEVGDMCAQNDSSFVKFADMPDYVVQRTWSNKAETAGNDPCVPSTPGSVYFISAPIFKDPLTITFGGQSVNVLGAHIAQGASETVELDLFSAAPTSGPWTVTATDLAALRGSTPQLQFAFDKPSGQNGDKIQMTITVVTASTRNHETFVIESKLGGVTSSWIGMVGN